MASFRNLAVLSLLASAGAFAPSPKRGHGASIITPPTTKDTIPFPATVVPESVTSLAMGGLSGTNTPSTPSQRNTYSEQSRAFRRTVYTYPDWVRHRSPDRFFSKLGNIFNSGLLRALVKEVGVITAVATTVVVWNCLAGTYTDFSGNGGTPGPLADFGLPLLGLPLTPFTLASPSLGLLLVFRTNTAYSRWDEARKAWGLNINRSRDLIRMATVWSAPKQEYHDAITNMDPRWAGETVSAEERDEALSRLAKMVWAFQRSLARQLSNPDDEAAFQAELYEKIDPETAKGIIAATHRPNRAMHEISKSVNRLPIHFLRRNEIDKDIMTFEDTCGGCERLFSSPVPVFYTRHTARFLTVWQLLLPFGLFDAFKGSWNHVAMIPSVAVISIFLFGIEELAVQLEEPFSILPMQGFCNKIYDNAHEIISWDPNEGKKKVKIGTADASDVGTGGESMSEGEVKMVQGTYSPIPSRL